MKNDLFYKALVAKMEEISIVSPQTVGPFTGVYKRIVPQFKVSPWRSAFVLSFAATVVLYLLFGTRLLVRLASILQYGF